MIKKTTSLSTAAILTVFATATETINDNLSVQGDINIGNDTTRIIGNYDGSPWFINPDGRFTFAAHHDWDRSFDIFLPNAEGGNSVEIGQRSKNNSTYNYDTIRFRNADLIVDDYMNLIVEGDIMVGSDNTAASTQNSTYGRKLFFQGAHTNSDELWIARYNVSGSPNASEIRVNIGDDPAHYGDKFVVGATSTTWHPRFLVQGDGKVGIGTTSPTHLLSVNGPIRAKEVIVDTGWPDFVFEDSYRLRSLKDVEHHIEEHGYLPDVPSAAIVESEGLSVGEAQKVMMQKIEELTLYMIDQEKTNQAQQREIEDLRKQLGQQNARYNSE